MRRIALVSLLLLATAGCKRPVHTMVVHVNVATVAPTPATATVTVGVWR